MKVLVVEDEQLAKITTDGAGPCSGSRWRTKGRVAMLSTCSESASDAGAAQSTRN